jgi:pyruvate dehydrogenase E2 component (dihydrolipoamide acetyltransferase)
MPISIVVPQLGESVAEGTVSRWLKNQGDKVRKEEPIVEIQTDKINVEIPSPADGTLSEILVQEGTTVLVGTEIARLAGAGDAAGAAAPVAKPRQPPRPRGRKRPRRREPRAWRRRWPPRPTGPWATVSRPTSGASTCRRRCAG